MASIKYTSLALDDDLTSQEEEPPPQEQQQNLKRQKLAPQKEQDFEKQELYECTEKDLESFAKFITALNNPPVKWTALADVEEAYEKLSRVQLVRGKLKMPRVLRFMEAKSNVKLVPPATVPAIPSFVKTYLEKEYEGDRRSFMEKRKKKEERDAERQFID